MDVRQRAHDILVGLTGSWVFEAMFNELQDEGFCRRVVMWYESEGATDRSDAIIEQYTVDRCEAADHSDSF